MTPDTLTTVAVGPLAIDLPDLPARSIEQDAGELWQWLGDGSALLSVTVAVRPTRIPNQLGAAGMLREYLWEITPTLLDFATRSLEVAVPGARHVAVAVATGSRGGVPERHVVAVANDGQDTAALVRVAVRDDDAAQGLAEAIVGSVVLPAPAGEPDGGRDDEPGADGSDPWVRA